MTYEDSSPNQEIIPTVLLLDVDGTGSDTRKHMGYWAKDEGGARVRVPGYNDRLAAAFPEIPLEFLEGLGAVRVAYRKQNPHLTHSQQAVQWEAEHPGSRLDSITSFYTGAAPEVFTDDLERRIRLWNRDPSNIGHGEYSDLAPAVARLHEMGMFIILLTQGSRERDTGEDGWQVDKIRGAPTIAPLAQHVAETLPSGGKGELIGRWYDANTDTFRIPRTDGGEPVMARGAVLVDDVEHNVAHIPSQAMGVLLDRSGKYEGRTLPPNVRAARSLSEVPAMVRDYEALRREK
jgi:hypothetical protein